MNFRAGSFWLAPVVGLLLAAGVANAAAPNKSGTGKSAISLPSGPGSVEGMGGSFEPQLNSGTVNYGVSLSVPAGRAGSGPALSLSYEGGRGNGVCGFGWSIGTGSIRRQSDKGFPSYSEADTFLMGGEELVPLSNAEGDWRCENDRGFQRMRRVADRNAWEVTEPNGTRHYYGEYRGENGRYSTVLNQGAFGSAFDRTYLWQINSTIDVHGNRTEYEYEPGEGALFLSRVTWSHWVNNGRTNYYEARLTYEDRPDNFEDFRSGFRFLIDRRLKRVDFNVVVGGVSKLIRAYRLDYEYAPQDLIAADPDANDTGVSMLRRVMFFGADGNTNNFLPPALFGYTPLKLGESRLQTLDPAPELNLAEERGNVQLTDIDGDGLPDLFQTTDFDQRFQLNRGEWAREGNPTALAFGPVIVKPRATAMQLSNPESSLMDFDGDGLVDYVQLTDSIFGGRELEVFRNASDLSRHDDSPAGFSDIVETSVNLPALLSLTNSATRQLDANFDKLTDFVTTEPGFFGRFIIAYRDGDQRWQRLETDYPPDMPPALTFAWNGASNTPAVHLADMNGDRMQDIVLVERQDVTFRVRWWPMTGLGTWGEAREMSATVPDVILDEVADLRDVYVQDITGDGLADLLLVDGSGETSRILLRINVSGSRWSLPVLRDGLPRYRPRDEGSSTTFRLVDLNGNGSTDLLWVNPGFNPGWQWLELMSSGKANLIRWTDNGIGRFTEITYATSTEDMVRAAEAGYPWQTKTPFPVSVIRRLRITGNQDVDETSDAGRPVSTDQLVTDFQYRDAYYDSFEKEFRGFAFAQKIDYGDDFLTDTNLVTIRPSAGWDRSRTPSGQLDAPSVITRLRFHTGAPDGVDNDEYPEAFSGARYADEKTPRGGREEEPLKGAQLSQEMVDGWVLHGGAAQGDFDRGCWLAANATNFDGRARMTPDDVVYARVMHEYTIRRLYRSDLPQHFSALSGGDAPSDFEEVLTPPGRFGTRIPSVNALPESGRTVSQVFLSRITGLQIEANGLFQAALAWPPAAPARTVQEMDNDDYGNTILSRSHGYVDDPTADDERVTRTSYALGGEALSRWILRLPSESTTSDENGVFVGGARHYYDGTDFVGLPLGQMGARGLETRTENLINGSVAVPALGTDSDRPGDPRRPAGASVTSARAAFDASGNLLATIDPLADPAHPELGHFTRARYDPDFNQFCVEERAIPGNGLPDHVTTAEYDYRWAAVTRSVGVNGHVSSWRYDFFGRLVAAIKPGDSDALPTLVYEYIPGDPIRNRVYRYDPLGNLTTGAALHVATRIVSRQREQAGQAGQFVSISYQDGAGHEMAVIHEGDFGGHWIVHKASSFTRRGTPKTAWLPYDFVSGTDDRSIPELDDFWRDGRPLLQARDGRPVVGTRVLADATGREIVFVNAPEAASSNGVPAEVLVRRTYRLPRTTTTYDEEDSDTASPHAGTPNTVRMDGLGRVVEQLESTRFDAEGRPTNGIVTWSTRYWYDLNDMLVRIRDSRGNESRFRYDALGRNIWLNDPDRGVMEMTYDDVSNHTETRDAKGQRIVYRHDGRNRLSAVDYIDDASTEFAYRRTPEVEFHYDVATNAVPHGDGTFATPTNVIGKLVWVADTAGAVHFSYDARDRATWQVREIDHPAGFGRVPFRMAWGYDSFDRTIRTVFPDNDEYAIRFGPRNLIRFIGGTAATVVSNISYAVSGKMTRIEYGNGVVTDMDHDPRLRLRSVRTQPRSGGPVVDYSYAYDGLSHVREIRDMRPATVRPAGSTLRNTQTFEYDDLYRLTSATFSFSAPGTAPREDGRINYRYDSIGNMLEQRATGAAGTGETPSNSGRMAYGGGAGTTDRVGRAGTEPGPHALTAAEKPGFGIEYDRNGNVTRLGDTRMKWDFDDRLVEVDNGSELASYRYNLEDVRMSRYVRPKPGATNAGPTETVLYPFPGYEVRPGNSAEKLISLPGILLARFTKSLSATPRVQRVELRAGWNLVSVGLTTTNLQSQLDSVRTPAVPVMRADTTNGMVAPLAGPVTGPAVVWVHARTNAVASIVGSVPEAGTAAVPARGAFLGAGLANRWRLPERFRTNSEIWRLTADGWIVPGRGPGASTDSGWVNGGEAVFVRPPGDTSLPVFAGIVAYYHGDHIGSTAIMTDGNGMRIEENTWFPYGGRRSRETLTDTPEPFGFTGRENDRETKFTYMTARYQSPEFARFMSVDPKLSVDPKSRMANPQGLNFYAYAQNNPLNWTDPTGCELEMDPLQEAQMRAYRIDQAQKNHQDPDAMVFELPPGMDGSSPPDWMPAGIAKGTEHYLGRMSVGSSGEVVFTGQNAQFEGEVLAGVWFGNKDYISGEAAITAKTSSKGFEVCGGLGGVILDAKYVFTIAKGCHNFSTGENTYKSMEFQREPKINHNGTKNPVPMSYGTRTTKIYQMQTHFNMKGTTERGSSKDGMATGDFQISAGVQGGGEVEWGFGAGIVKPVTVSGSVKGVIAVEVKKKGSEYTVAVLARGEVEAKLVIALPSTGGLISFPVVISGKGETRVIARYHSKN